MKIAINTSFGGFSLSRHAEFLLKNMGMSTDRHDIKRDDPRLIEIIEKLGDEASLTGDIKVIEIPDDVKDWYIEEYDGIEWVAEGRKWTGRNEERSSG